MRKLFLVLFLVTIIGKAQSQRVKIPIDSSRWYQVNYATGTLGALFDGDVSTVAFTGWTKILFNYEAYYPILDGEEISIDSIRMYDSKGVFTTAPFKIYAINENWERKLIGSFVGDVYNMWVGPYPERRFTYKLDTAIKGIKYLLFNINGNNFPAEIELFGNYNPPASVGNQLQKQRVPLKNMMGVNGFAWDLADGVHKGTVVEEKMKAMKSFRGFRQYIDWERLEPEEGKYYFSPLAGGGWQLDTVYKRCQQEDIDVLPCIQNIPPWMVNTYPDSLKAKDNNPVRYGKSLSDPLSYIEQAKLGFQFAARYGRNKNIDSSSISVYGVPAWKNQPVNTPKIGLGLIRYIECGNEVDKFWRGRDAYLSGREYAANLSAFYDGHKKSMGPGVGVKNADSAMLVVMCGVASPVTDYFRGIVDWCKEFRGYKSDGKVDLCFDIINYHYYSSDRAFGQTNGTRGIAPELSRAASIASTFIEAAQKYAGDMPVWNTEQGYDVNQNSVLRAIPIGTKTVLETQADWTLRTALLNARQGLQKGFFYQAYDANIESSVKFSSMGLLNKTDYSRKPAADFLFQTAKLFGEYTFVETLNSDPFVDRYDYNGRSMYALLVPDEIGRTANYDLNLNNADSAIIYKPVANSDSMLAVKVATSNGILNLTVTETPQFIVPFSFNSATGTINNAITYSSQESVMLFLKESTTISDLSVYPNPAKNSIGVSTTIEGQKQAIIVDMQGRKMNTFSFFGKKSNIDINSLSAGAYVLNLVDFSGRSINSKMFIKQ